MGFLDSLFGTGGSASQEQARTTAQTNYPDWYNRLQQANLLRGAEAAFETYQPYGGPRMALAGPAQQAARAGFGGLAGIAAISEGLRQNETIEKISFNFCGIPTEGCKYIQDILANLNSKLRT